MSALGLRPALSAPATATALGAVLTRLNAAGEVAHEESIGEYAILQRLQQGGAPTDTALNDYRVDIPVADVQRFDVILARLLDGQPMAVREKGPLFVMYPFADHAELRNAVYYSRCAWQLKAIEVV